MSTEDGSCPVSMLEADTVGRFVTRRWHTPPRTESLHIRSLTFASSHPVRCSLLVAHCTFFLLHHSPCIPASSDTTTTTAARPLHCSLFISIPTLLTTLTTSNTTTTHLPLPLSFPPHLLSSCAGVTSASACFCWVCLASALVPGPPLVLLLFFDFFVAFSSRLPLRFSFSRCPHLFWCLRVVVGGSWCVSVCLDRCGSFSLKPFFLSSFLPSSLRLPYNPFCPSPLRLSRESPQSFPPPPHFLFFPWGICYPVGCCRHHFCPLL